jgi:glycosyltransferase involved in cell wall biosynthesis
VIVPTRAARDAWTGSGVPGARVRVSPLAVDGEFFSRPAAPLPIVVGDGRDLASFGTRFLHVGELRPRKNHLGILRAWLDATRPDDDAVLILKCPAHAHMVAQLREDVAALQSRLGRLLSAAAPVVVMPSTLTEAEMLGLYAAATHYISMSHGEGWDQVMMEAAVAGLRLVAPRHTAYLEWLRIFFDGLRWWEPDAEAAAEIIRGIVDGRGRAKPPPSARLASTYTWESAARQLLEAMDAGTARH